MTPSLQHLHDRVFKQKFIHVSEGLTKEQRIFKKYGREKVAEYLHTFNLIGINNATHINALTFDIDTPTLFTPPDEHPTVVTRNKINDKFHTTFLLDNPLNLRTPKLKTWYKEEIKPWIKDTSILIGADGDYSNQLIKNPFNKNAYNIQATGIELKSIFDILEPYHSKHSEMDVIRKEATQDNKYHSKAYKTALRLLREHSLNNIKLCYVDFEQYEINMQTFALSILSDQVKEITGQIIKPSELNKITKDTIQFTREKTSLFSKVQSERSKLANAKRWGNQVEQNTLNIQKAIYSLSAEGKKPTYKEIAKRVRLSEPTLKRYYAKVIKTCR